MAENGAAHLLGVKPRIGTGFSALVRRLDDAGTMPANGGVRAMPDGSAIAVTTREQYLDAEELLAAIRKIVREELLAALQATAD